MTVRALSSLGAPSSVADRPREEGVRAGVARLPVDVISATRGDDRGSGAWLPRTGAVALVMSASTTATSWRAGRETAAEFIPAAVARSAAYGAASGAASGVANGAGGGSSRSAKGDPLVDPSDGSLTPPSVADRARSAGGGGGGASATASERPVTATTHSAGFDSPPDTPPDASPDASQRPREGAEAPSARPQPPQSALDPALTAEEQLMVDELQARDRKVRSHEAAHQAAGGALAGGATFTYQQGPDGRSYAVGGEVPIELSRGGTPEETLQRARRVRAAALAPADPSGQDLRVAAAATALELEASVEVAQRQRDPRGGSQRLARGTGARASAAYRAASPR